MNDEPTRTEETKTFYEMLDLFPGNDEIGEAPFLGDAVIEVIDGQWRKESKDLWRFWRFPDEE